MKKNREPLLEANKEVGLEADTEKTHYMVMYRHQNAEQNNNLQIYNKPVNNVVKFKYLHSIVIKQISLAKNLRGH